MHYAVSIISYTDRTTDPPESNALSKICIITVCIITISTVYKSPPLVAQRSLACRDKVSSQSIFFSLRISTWPTILKLAIKPYLVDLTATAVTPYLVSEYERMTYYHGISLDPPELLYRSDLLDSPFPLSKGRHTPTPTKTVHGVFNT